MQGSNDPALNFIQSLQYELLRYIGQRFSWGNIPLTIYSLMLPIVTSLQSMAASFVCQHRIVKLPWAFVYAP